jgi:hypothetical protein
MSDEYSSPISLQLTADEALVLFEFLQRFSETEKLVIDDPAEERTLWKICGVLEKTLSEPFSKDYGQSLKQARERLRAL